MEKGFAPSALRMPNSRVRSLTVISMIFDTPTMPLSRVKIPITQMAVRSKPATFCVCMYCVKRFHIHIDFTVLFLEGFVGRFARQIFGGEDDVVEFIAFVIDGLHGGEGGKGQAALVSLVFVQSDYPVGYTACIDKPADWFRT